MNNTKELLKRRKKNRNSVVKKNWLNKSKEEKQEFISKLVKSVIITKDNKNELHIEKINFRKSFMGMLIKLVDKDVFDVLVPCEINGKDDVILGTGNINNSQIQEYMLIIKCKQAKLSQSDFVRNLINQYFDSQPTKIEIEDIKISLTKIIDNLSLLKSQMDFFNFSDYSIFITKQISNIRDIINQFQK